MRSKSRTRNGPGSRVRRGSLKYRSFLTPWLTLAWLVSSAMGDVPVTEGSEIILFEDPVCQPDARAAPVLTSAVVEVVTLNLAHGRGAGRNQLLQSGDAARSNIARIAQRINAWGADAVALQEADAPSLWSGQFDHVKAIADATDYDCRHHGVHAKSRLYSFGTALLSRTRFTRAATVHFPPTPPTTMKGFVAAQILWNPDNRLEKPVDLTLVSVHLDFSRQRSRQLQFSELTRVLVNFPKPLIIMGDLNTEWDASNQLLRDFVTTMGLVAFEPENASLGTYNRGAKRLDWILVSDDLVFSDHEVISDVVSDHHPVRASIQLAQKPELQPP